MSLCIKRWITQSLDTLRTEVLDYLKRLWELKGNKRSKEVHKRAIKVKTLGFKVLEWNSVGLMEGIVSSDFSVIVSLTFI